MKDDQRNDPLKHSRFKRMPKVWRLGQDAPRAVDPLGDEFRVTVFLTNRQADRAEREAIDTGLGDLQAWCQATLRALIDRLGTGGETPVRFPVVRTRPKVTAAELEAELAIPDDPAFLREWAGAEDAEPDVEVLPDDHADRVEGQPSPEVPADPGQEPGDFSQFDPLIEPVLTSLRMGRRPSAEDVDRLARAVEHYAQGTEAVEALPRDAVRSLYRLSLESQVLMTEVHPALGLDLTVVTLVRRLQAAVGAVLDR